MFTFDGVDGTVTFHFVLSWPTPDISKGFYFTFWSENTFEFESFQQEKVFRV